jgi:hypothetical protein
MHDHRTPVIGTHSRKVIAKSKPGFGVFALPSNCERIFDRAPKSPAVWGGGIIKCVQFRCNCTAHSSYASLSAPKFRQVGRLLNQVRCDFGLLLLVISLGGAREVTDAPRRHHVASHSFEQSISSKS